MMRIPGRHSALAIVVGLILIVAACQGAGIQPPSSASAAAPATAGPAGTADGRGRPVIIDTDMAVDDWLAILYLLGRGETRVHAITVTGAGEAHCGPGVEHARELVALAGRPDIPVACGRETPLVGSHAFPAAWREGVDALLGLSLPPNPEPGAPAAGAAVELLARTLEASSEDVSILALGPLTNVAELLRDEPDAASRIAAIFVMGGAVDVEGNVGTSGVGIDNPFAEWNVYVDPVAADAVLSSGAAVTLVPLDATNDAPLTRAFTDRLARDAASPTASFVREVLGRIGPLVESGTYYFWDPLASALLVDESLGSYETRDLVVVTAEGRESGRVVASPDGGPVRFAVSADTARFEQSLIDTWNGRAR